MNKKRTVKNKLLRISRTGQQRELKIKTKMKTVTNN